MNIGDNLRHQFVRLSYSPEIMSMEFTREEMITIYDYIKGKEQEIERLNNIINKTIHRIQLIQMEGVVSIKDLGTLVNILLGVDKEWI